MRMRKSRLARSTGKTLRPRWDADERALYFDGVLIKRFRQLAPDQELILRSFQEQRWRRGIHDPLPPNGHAHPKLRLRDAIARLNRHQANQWVRFRGDGTGTRILWEPIEVD